MNSIKELQDRIKELKHSIKLHQSYITIYQNEDFNCFMYGLLDVKCKELITKLGSNIITEEQRNNTINLLTGIGTLQQYINNIRLDLDNLKQELIDTEYLLAEKFNSNG